GWNHRDDGPPATPGTMRGTLAGRPFTPASALGAAPHIVFTGRVPPKPVADGNVQFGAGVIDDRPSHSEPAQLTPVGKGAANRTRPPSAGGSFRPVGDRVRMETHVAAATPADERHLYDRQPVPTGPFEQARDAFDGPSQRGPHAGTGLVAVIRHQHVQQPAGV